MSGRVLLVRSPGSRGLDCFLDAFRMVSLEVEVLSPEELQDLRLDQKQLCAKYQVVVIPSGQTYSGVLGHGKILATTLKLGLGWDLLKYCENGGWVLGVGTGFQCLLEMGCFGDDYALMMNPSGMMEEKWMKVTPVGGRSLWLRGMGTVELPIAHRDTQFVIDPFAFVEAKGKLERLGLSCLKDESQNQILGLCDLSGRMLGMIPEPQYFLSWTDREDWQSNPTRAGAPGQGLMLFENLAKALS